VPAHELAVEFVHLAAEGLEIDGRARGHRRDRVAQSALAETVFVGDRLLYQGWWKSR
jgi:hypothetical protein